MTTLSICIPTYNRSDYLRKTLESIVVQDVFLNSDEINVYISDNASSDNTKELVASYMEKYPNKIFYNRNETNIGFANLEKVLSLADGKFLKLHNDTLEFLVEKKPLEKMLNTIKSFPNEDVIIFFTNECACLKEDLLCENFDSFVKTVSYYTTWSGSFGIWKNDYTEISNLFKQKNYTEIPQTYILFSLLEKGKKGFCVKEKYFEWQHMEKKGGSYNIAQVFGENYLDMLNEFLGKNLLSIETYKSEKYKILKFINEFYFDVKGRYDFQKTGYFKYIYKYYKFNPYFYRLFAKTCIYGKIYKFKRLFKKQPA